jgi:2'-5' RNA ligase
MEAQLSFFGQPRRRSTTTALPKREAPSIVIYFAILPPEDVCRAMIRLRQETVARERIFGRPVAPERLHISIAPLMRCSPSNIPDVEPRARDIAAGVTMPSFDVVFDRVQTFNSKDRDEAHRRYYLVLDGRDLPGLMRLNDLFRRAFVRCGSIAAMPSAFNPHLTLFYANRPIAPRDVPPIRWTVRDIALVQSGQGRYVILKRWPLKAREGSHHLPSPKIGGG